MSGPGDAVVPTLLMLRLGDGDDMWSGAAARRATGDMVAARALAAVSGDAGMVIGALAGNDVSAAAAMVDGAGAGGIRFPGGIGAVSTVVVIVVGIVPGGEDRLRTGSELAAAELALALAAAAANRVTAGAAGVTVGTTGVDDLASKG